MGGTKTSLVIVQPRDRQLLTALGIMRFVDREQARVIAPFGSITRANARLLLLTQAGYLRRQFIGTISAGRKAIYSLAPQGALLVDIDLAALKRQPTQFRQGDYYFEHQLSLNRIYLALRVLDGRTCGYGLRRFKTFNQPIISGLSLIPDALCELETPQGMHACFIEADLGTETRKVWQQKVEAYFSLAVSGEFERRFQHEHFRVLVVTTSVRRVKHLQAVMRQRTDKLFFLTTFDDINRDVIVAPIWYRPIGEQSCSL